VAEFRKSGRQIFTAVFATRTLIIKF